jgi:hypothetical protein
MSKSSIITDPDWLPNPTPGGVMKQTLKITHFIGRSENAVRIQIAVALIAFLLLSLLRKMAQD